VLVLVSWKNSQDILGSVVCYFGGPILVCFFFTGLVLNSDDGRVLFHGCNN